MITIPERLARNWIIEPGRFLRATYKYGDKGRIFKFCFQPEKEELIFDIPGIHHNMMILNHSSKKFNDYIRGICFWDKRVIYLRGHTNEGWLKATKKMVYANGVPKSFRVIWGPEAAKELAEDLKGL